MSNNQQQQIPLSPVPASPINTQQQPQLDTHLYDEISGTFGRFLFWKKSNLDMLTKYYLSQLDKIEKHSSSFIFRRSC